MTFKTLTYRALLLLVLVVATDQLVGYYFDRLYEANRCDFNHGKVNIFLANEPCDTLFVGSSRVLHTINPTHFSPTAKVLAFQQRNICHNVAVVDLLFQHNKQPRKLLVFNLDLDDLFHTSDEDLLQKVLDLRYFYHENKLIGNLIDRLGPQERIKFLSRTYKHNGAGWKLVAFPLHQNCPEVTYTGFVPLQPTNRDHIRTVQSLMSDFKGFNYAHRNELTYEMIDHLIDLCARNNTELILINTPYFRYPKEWREISTAFKKYCANKGVQYIDFNVEHTLDLSHSMYWYDNMHLNEKGANLFSKHMERIFSQH